MTEREPPGVTFESWVEKQIREAMDRGKLDNLPGAGKPIPNLDKVDDEMWWIRQKPRREGASTEATTPTPLRLRKEVARLPETVRGLASEEAVRETVAAVNRRIAGWLVAPFGPQVALLPVEADAVVAEWRAHRAADEAPVPVAAVPMEPRRRRWRRTG